MSTKFQRYYVLTVQGNDGNLIEIKNPFTVEFSIVRHILASSNTGSFRVYNLNQRTRGNIYRDKFNFNDIRTLTFKAGYGNADPLPTVFNGNIKQAYSNRGSGSVNFITEIQGYDMGWSMVKSFSNFTLSPSEDAPVTKQKVVDLLIADMIINTPVKALKMGIVGNFAGVYPRGRTVFGPTWDILQTETGKSCFIDNGKVNAIKNTEAIEGDIQVIDSSSGLLSTPKRTETYLTVDILFEPGLVIGQRILLDSRSSPQFNGYYKIIGIEHSGIISDAVGGRCVTTVTLDLGNQIFNLLSNNTQGTTP